MFKNWTLTVEELTKEGRTRPLAAISLNICLFILNKFPVEAKFKLRPLQAEINQCTIVIVFSSKPFTKIKNCLPSVEKKMSINNELNQEDKSDAYNLSFNEKKIFLNNDIENIQKPYFTKFVLLYFLNTYL